MSNWGHGEYPPGGYPTPEASGVMGQPDLPPPPDGYTLTQPIEQVAAVPVTAGSAVPQAADITSIGVAIMPGMPLPDWVNQQSLAEVLVPALENIPNYPLTHPVPGFQHGSTGSLGGENAGLGMPDPRHRSEHPAGPVSWGAPPAPDATPAPTSMPVPAPHTVPPAAVPAPVAVSPQPQQPVAPSAPDQQFDWLLQPDVTGPERIPGYAPPPAAPGDTSAGTALPIPPAPQGFYLPAGPVSDQNSDVPVPAPPEGYYVAETISADVPLSTPVPPPPEGFYIPDPSAFAQPAATAAR